MDVNDRGVLLTGASGGIGRALAAALAAAGARLALSGRNAVALDEARAALAGLARRPVAALPADLDDLAALPGLLREA